VAEHVVVGGGLAGITAALRLADAGHAVTLVEGRPRLGGAACSFRRDGLDVDNGQHVFLRCCTAYRELLERLHATPLTTLQPRLDIPVLGGGRVARLTRTPGIPAPAHLAASLVRYPLLGWADKARLGRAVAGLLRLDPADARVDARSFGSFLRATGQSERAVAGLWSLIGTATVNAHPDDASLALAAKVFRTGLLEHADAADVGYAAAPLGAIHDLAARRALEDAGVQVLLRTRAEDVRPGAVTVKTARGTQTLAADGVVLAVPHAAVPASLADPAWQRLGASPIVNIHVVYDRKVTDLPFAAAVGSPVQWVFDRSSPSGLGSGQYLAVTVSAADALLRRRSADLVAQFVAELARLLPHAARASVRDAFVTREPAATFRQAPGTATLRPRSATAMDGVVLAGAWTATGWPDTMESAVRSGRAAADQLLAEVAAGTTLEVVS
jgi:squalene-associated FAD-dependent desaturase